MDSQSRKHINHTSFRSSILLLRQSSQVLNLLLYKHKKPAKLRNVVQYRGLVSIFYNHRKPTILRNIAQHCAFQIPDGVSKSIKSVSVKHTCFVAKCSVRLESGTESSSSAKDYLDIIFVYPSNINEAGAVAVLEIERRRKVEGIRQRNRAATGTHSSWHYLRHLHCRT